MLGIGETNHCDPKLAIGGVGAGIKPSALRNTAKVGSYFRLRKQNIPPL